MLVIQLRPKKFIDTNILLYYAFVSFEQYEKLDHERKNINRFHHISTEALRLKMRVKISELTQIQLPFSIDYQITQRGIA